MQMLCILLGFAGPQCHCHVGVVGSGSRSGSGSVSAAFSHSQNYLFAFYRCHVAAFPLAVAVVAALNLWHSLLAARPGKTTTTTATATTQSVGKFYKFLAHGCNNNGNDNGNCRCGLFCRREKKGKAGGKTVGKA